MSAQKKTVVVAGIAAIIMTVAFIVLSVGKRSFEKTASKSLLHAAELKTLTFESSLNSQLTLVRQMIRSPSICQYLENPYNEELKNAAYQEFSAFSNSFLSKSVFWVSDIEMNFYQDMEMKYAVDPEDPNNYWYKMTVYETEEYNFNINYNPDLNVTMLWVNAVIRNSDRKPVGMAGTGIPLTDFINSMYIGLDEDIEMYLYNDNLEITGAKDSSVLSQNATLLNKMGDLAKTDAVPVSTTVYSAMRNEYVLAPLSLINWHMAMRIHFSAKQFLSNAITPFAICMTVIILAAAFFISANLYIHISTLKVAVDGLSSGNADLTQRISLQSDSSFKIMKRLVDSVNAFISKLQGIVSSVKETNDELILRGEKLKAGTEDTKNSISQIVSSIQDIGGNIERQSSSVEQTSSAVNQISSNIQSLNKMIDAQSSSVNDASAAVEEMVGNILSVNSISDRLTSQFSTFQEKTVQTVSKQDQVNAMILQIQQQSKMLQEANLVISSIADQTNLLAMNAAIEAAHAGDAGKGFSVVADEIRKLSENSSLQSKTIGEQLCGIEDSISKIVGVSQESQAMMSSVTKDLKDTDSLIREISGAMKEQQEGSSQISASLTALRNSSSEVLGASQEMQEGNKSILDEVRILEEATIEIRDRMQEMTAGARKINETGIALSDISIEMESSIESIGTQLNQFKA